MVIVADLVLLLLSGKAIVLVLVLVSVVLVVVVVVIVIVLGLVLVLGVGVLQMSVICTTRLSLTRRTVQGCRGGHTGGEDAENGGKLHDGSE